jgi:S-DNA-T family DNA segregation ATPase FtsK/SpoIIIE
VGQRNLVDYNRKVAEGKYDGDTLMKHRKMPYIVCVIDELADLMLTASKEIEVPIIRLAQKARAIGIHLILATQRPSVNVITGIIKANFPARIGFLVASRIDSRTILDMGGAEKLLGNGDLLYLSPGSPKPIRVQNSFISTDEVERICEFIHSQDGYSMPYQLPSTVLKNRQSANDYDAGDTDELFEEAGRIIIETQTCSVSMLQRKLRVGYARAGKLVDELERAGVVGAHNGSKPREVLMESQSEFDAIL